MKFQQHSHGLLALGLASAALGWFGRGCLVEEKCYVDSDCGTSEVCSATGRCEFQCSVDGDCDRAFGTESVCREKRCVQPVECTTCAFFHADALCRHGVCQQGSCHAGYFDLDGDASNGCEVPCTPSGPEVCDRADNDCNGSIDEGIDLESDLSNCGQCGNACSSPPHADPVCVAGRCLYTCQAGFFENDGVAEDGCESTNCVPAREICDGRDNDCNCASDSNGDSLFCGPGDSGVDEGFDQSLVASCGPFCTVCAYPHAEASCVQGACVMGSCEAGWFDADGLTLTGCEYACTPSGAEACDGLDNDCDGQTDEGDVCATLCPADMVAIGLRYCVDRYEASRVDATLTDQGLDVSVAISRPGVMPWMVNPMTEAHRTEFRAACEAAGKHLCTREEWGAACTGPAQTPHVYGSLFDREACNCVDTFCDDYCAEHAIAPCSTAQNCGYEYSCYHAMPTGQYPRCTNEYGTFDMNGNVWEIVSSSQDSRGYEVRGGAFNCANPSERVTCSFNAGWLELFAGFRCCKEL